MLNDGGGNGCNHWRGKDNGVDSCMEDVGECMVTAWAVCVMEIQRWDAFPWPLD